MGWVKPTGYIDSDNKSEIVIYSQPSTIFVLEFNGTNLYNDYNISIDMGLDNSKLDQSTLYCNTNECLLTTNGLVGTAGLLSVVLTNATHELDAHNISVGVYEMLCPPTIKNMDYKDYDGDGTSEYISSYYNANGNGADEINILYVDTSSGSIVIDDLNIYVSNDVVQQEQNPYYCSNVTLFDGNDYHPVGRFLTSPLVFDIDGISGNGLETAIAYLYDFDEFYLYSYLQDGTLLNHYPQDILFVPNQADGILVSNVIRMKAYDNADSFCVMGYAQDEDLLDLICASETSGQSYKSEQFFYDTSYNITRTFERYTPITHAGQYDHTLEDGYDLHEVVNSYGVFRLDRDVIYSDLELIFENPKQDSAVIMSDVEKTGYDDMLILTSTNLWYINDGFTKVGGKINEYCINPCINSVWKYAENGSLTSEITITPTDADGDLVSARAGLYYGTANEQLSNWTENQTSGTTFTFPFVVNSSITAGTIALYGRDTSNPDEVDSILLSFSTGVNGVVLGDCMTCIGDIVADTEAEADGSDITEAELEDLGDEITNLFGIESKYQIFIALLIIILSVFGSLMILSHYGITNGNVMIVVPSLMGAMAWIFSVAIGWCPAWTIIVMLLFGSAFIGWKFFNSGNSGGGL